MSHIPIHLRWTYLVLYALAWRHDYEWLDETYQQLSQTFTALEGNEISPEGIRQRLRRLSEFDLVQRRGAGSQYRTYLVVRHETGDLGVSSRYTKSEIGVSPEIHPITNSAVVVEPDLENLPEDQQQQQLLNSELDIERNEELLEAMGVVGGPLYRLARETWVTPDYLEAIMAYRAAEAAKGNNLGPGWVVKHVGEGWPAPAADPGPDDDRYRYIRGKYRDYIKH